MSVTSTIDDHKTKILGMVTVGLGFIQAYPGLKDMLSENVYGWTMFVIGLLVTMCGFYNTAKANQTKQTLIPPSSSRFIGVFVLVAGLAVLAGCQTPPTTVVKTACEYGDSFSITTCSKGIAETYEVYQKQALAIVQDPSIPDDLKDRVRAADAAMTPVLVEMLKATRVYNDIRMQLEAGEDEAQRMEIANRELLNWINQTEQALYRLIEVLRN